MATAKLNREEIKCDRIVKGLIDRLMATEKRLEAAQKQISELYEIAAENSGWLTADGRLRFRVLRDQSESTEQLDVFVQPVETVPKS